MSFLIPFIVFLLIVKQSRGCRLLGPFMYLSFSTRRTLFWFFLHERPNILCDTLSTYIPIKSSSPESFAEGINIVASYLTYNFVCNSSCSQALENVPEMDNLGASLAGGESAAPLFRGARRARRRSRRAPNAHPTTGISASAPARLIERPPSTALSFTPVSHAHGRSVHPDD